MTYYLTRRSSTLALFAGIVALGSRAEAETAASTAVSPQADRRAIRGMAGTFHVHFDFRETTAFLADYMPIAPAGTSGHEVVRIAEDTGDFISLQHLLVADIEGAAPVVVKHWRQDWAFEPSEVLTYAGQSHWTVTPIAPAARRGVWTQTVWQTDDSPRYGGAGIWVHDYGVSRWTSEETARPLARRDATRHPPYDRYVGRNRHALTPTGWVHEQDNAKIGRHGGGLMTYVHESVVNTSTRATNFPISAADTYWSATQVYWAAVRVAWAQKISAARGVTVQEEAQNGSVTGPRLMGMADEIQSGHLTVAAAIVAARTLIAALPR